MKSSPDGVTGSHAGLKILSEENAGAGSIPAWGTLDGELAQLARALDLHSKGHGFDSLLLHNMPVWRNDSVYNY